MHVSVRKGLDSAMLALGVRILEGIFVIGGLGCVAVLALTTLEDVRVLLGKEQH
jgi:hypothetical protein